MSAQHITSRTIQSAFVESTARVPIPSSSIVFDLDPTPRTINGTPTAYQDFGGITPATAHNQPVGMLLDTKDTSRWGESIAVSSMASGWTGDTSGWTFSAESASYIGDGSAASSSLSGFYPSSGYVVPIELEYTISGYSGVVGAAGMSAYSLVRFPTTTEAISTTVSANGTYKFRGYWRGSGFAPLVLYAAPSNSFTMSRPVVRRIDGNHGTQTVSSARPALQYVQDNRPGWALKFDLFDDALTMYSVTPAGAGCTVYIAGLTSVTRVDGVTIGNQYTLTGYQYVRRVIALTRSPTASEDARIRKYLYEMYGVF